MSNCTSCGAVFACAMADPVDGVACWCTNLSPLPAPTIAALAATTGARCLCPVCLAAAVANAAAALPSV